MANALCPDCNPDRLQTMCSTTGETEGVKCVSCGMFFPVHAYAILTWTSKDYKRYCEINGPGKPRPPYGDFVDEVELLRKRVNELETLLRGNPETAPAVK